MRSAELAEAALRMKSTAFDAEDFWTTFEVIENGELGTAIPSDRRLTQQGRCGMIVSTTPRPFRAVNDSSVEGQGSRRDGVSCSPLQLSSNPLIPTVCCTLLQPQVFTSHLPADTTSCVTNYRFESRWINEPNELKVLGRRDVDLILLNLPLRQNCKSS